MTSFAKLQKYPFVCRICLRPEDSKTMTSLDTEEDCYEGTIRDFLATVTSPVDEDKRHLFPRSICAQCRKSLETFARFRAKLRSVHAFMNALVELRQSNVEPIRKLFHSNQTVLTELKLCSKAGFKAEDLIEEFPQFEIASLPPTLMNCLYVEKIETEETVAKQEVADEGILFTVECLPDGFIGFKEEAVFEGLDFETASPAKDEAIDYNWEFLDVDVAEEDVDWKSPAKTKKRKKKEFDEPESKKKALKLDEALRCTKPKCSFETFYACRMEIHQKAHVRRENKIYHCKEADCTAEFTCRSQLSLHVEVQHKSWVCELCGRKFVHRSAITQHMVRAHDEGEAKYSCEYCQKSYKLLADLRIHVRDFHRPRKVFKCDTCGLAFRHNHILQNHKLWHSDAFNFSCEQCDKKFKTKGALGKHTVKVHRAPIYECEHCSRKINTRGMLLDHIEHVHEIQMRFICEVCVDVFDSREKLAAHQARHEHPKFLECARCLAVQLTQESLLDHLCITYRDDYVCCGRDLVSHQQYNKHQFLKHDVKVNARVKPVPGVLLGRLRATRKRVETCSKCKAFFPTKTQRDKHMKDCTDQ